MASEANINCGNRTAIIAGTRTPFVKAGTAFVEHSMQDLGVHAVSELVKRSDIDPNIIDECIYSTVLLDPRTPNWARELIFQAGLPKTISAHSVSNNCISGLLAITVASENIFAGRTEIAIAGGTESMSNPSLLYNPRGSQLFLKLSRARSLGQKLGLLTGFRPGFCLPKAPSVTEPSTGLTMGQHMEISAKEFSIPRDQQDELALRSHQNAHKGTEEGFLTDEIAPLSGVNKDLLVRADTSLEKLAKLRPVFDRSEKGTLTAGNSSALTDGASAVLLMSEKRAQTEGREPLAFIRDYEYSAISPDDGLLMAPGVAVPRLLKRQGLTLADFDMVEIHEAFAAQVLANAKVWEEGWKEEAIGALDWSKVNMLGGSIALGHPFAATGGRIVTTLANHLKRNYWKRGLISICAAGAMACAMIIERE